MSWATALVAATGLAGAALLARRILTRRLAVLAGQTENWVDDLALELLRRTHGAAILVAAGALGAQLVPLPALAARAVGVIVARWDS